MTKKFSLLAALFIMPFILLSQKTSANIKLSSSPPIKLTSINFYDDDRFDDKSKLLLKLGDNKKVNTRNFKNDEIQSVSLTNVKKGTKVVLYDSTKDYKAHHKRHTIITVNNSFEGTYFIPDLGQKHSDQFVTISPEKTTCSKVVVNAGENTNQWRCKGPDGKVSRVRINCLNKNECDR